MWFQVAYSFDAGPNAVIFALDDTVPEFVAAVQHSFPPEPNGDKWVVAPSGSLGGRWGGRGGCPRGDHRRWDLGPGHVRVQPAAPGRTAAVLGGPLLSGETCAHQGCLSSATVGGSATSLWRPWVLPQQAGQTL